jgi:hypothetical protein
MDLDTMLAKAAPARRVPLDGPDSPAAVSLYRRITAARPSYTTVEAPSDRTAGRRRILLPVTVGAAALAAAATALALISGSPVSAARHQGGPPHATLAAWTTIRRPGGLVQVTIRQLRDPEGLAGALRADGVPVNVQFIAHEFAGGTGDEEMPRACVAPRMSHEASANLQARILPLAFPGTIPGIPTVKVPGTSQASTSNGITTYTGEGPDVNPDTVLYIQPSAIPRGIGLYLAAWVAAAGTRDADYLEVQTGLVVASSQCTGS